MLKNQLGWTAESITANELALVNAYRNKVSEMLENTQSDWGSEFDDWEARFG